ncbi:hypothetical protein [Natronosalvus rutilus]|uniref:Uncharacterized protein n=1 Tax=Natronosalvus rutilus TaxID=2953753 RepID=A0A9E7NDN2_9EURY|nr:hypothetical protein [Natronosalvus rutilus]UTF55950.1 hypothetical protein NGM29_20885 [Natronosalvus rutilus]
MTDCGTLDEERRKVLYAVPDDHNPTPERLEASREAAEAHDVIVTPNTDTLGKEVQITLDDDELVKSVQTQIAQARKAGTPPADSPQKEEEPEPEDIQDSPRVDEPTPTQPRNSVVTGTPP